MTLRNVGSNQTEISKPDGTVIFFSYATPVAAFVPGTGYIRTSMRHSTTTSKHINKWLGSVNAKSVDQEQLDAMA